MCAVARKVHWLTNHSTKLYRKKYRSFVVSMLRVMCTCTNRQQQTHVVLQGKLQLMFQSSLNLHVGKLICRTTNVDSTKYIIIMKLYWKIPQVCCRVYCYECTSNNVNGNK